MKIELLTENSEHLERGVRYFWDKWGNEANFNFYKDCIESSSVIKQSLPGFYLMLEEGEIIGSYALLTNDLISRQDLFPWLACLYVEEKYRKLGLASVLLDHAMQEALNWGFKTLYLSTDMDDFYEKKGWKFQTVGYTAFGEEIKIYSVSLK
ncbi:MAG: GNAT family N-acetyltransferase [Mameliella sp.]|nr:GNAT family N-acetyltransferase [Phaeodactylibacter sp.]NRA48529.1 GNAT family N-acetyltransferase [Phaeodactylibacter sp.]